jgi:hypothetical protein
MIESMDDEKGILKLRLNHLFIEIYFTCQDPHAHEQLVYFFSQFSQKITFSFSGVLSLVTRYSVAANRKKKII